MSKKFEDYEAEVETVENKTEKQCIEERSSFRKYLLETKSSLLELVEQDAKEKESVSAPSYSRISKDKKFPLSNHQVSMVIGRNGQLLLMTLTPCSTTTKKWQIFKNFII